MTVKRLIRKLAFWRKPERSSQAPLWLTLQNRLYMGHLVSRSEWGMIIKTIAAEMDRQIIEDAGTPIGIWYKENPVDWLKREAARAESRL